MENGHTAAANGDGDVGAAKPKKSPVPWSNADPPGDAGGGDGGGGGGGGAGGGSDETIISEAQMVDLEQAAMHLPFQEVVKRFERVAETKGGEAKRAAFFDTALHQQLKVCMCK